MSEQMDLSRDWKKESWKEKDMIVPTMQIPDKKKPFVPKPEERYAVNKFLDTPENRKRFERMTLQGVTDVVNSEHLVDAKGKSIRKFTPSAIKHCCQTVGIETNGGNGKTRQKLGYVTVLVQNQRILAQTLLDIFPIPQEIRPKLATIAKGGKGATA